MNISIHYVYAVLIYCMCSVMYSAALCNKPIIVVTFVIIIIFLKMCVHRTLYHIVSTLISFHRLHVLPFVSQKTISWICFFICMNLSKGIFHHSRDNEQGIFPGHNKFIEYHMPCKHPSYNSRK